MLRKYGFSDRFCSLYEGFSSSDKDALDCLLKSGSWQTEKVKASHVEYVVEHLFSSRLENKDGIYGLFFRMLASNNYANGLISDSVFNSVLKCYCVEYVSILNSMDFYSRGFCLNNLACVFNNDNFSRLGLSDLEIENIFAMQKCEIQRIDASFESFVNVSRIIISKLRVNDKIKSRFEKFYDIVTSRMRLSSSSHKEFFRDLVENGYLFFHFLLSDSCENGFDDDMLLEKLFEFMCRSDSNWSLLATMLASSNYSKGLIDKKYFGLIPCFKDWGHGNVIPKIVSFVFSSEYYAMGFITDEHLKQLFNSKRWFWPVLYVISIIIDTKGISEDDKYSYILGMLDSDSDSIRILCTRFWESVMDKKIVLDEIDIIPSSPGGEPILRKLLKLAADYVKTQIFFPPLLRADMSRKPRARLRVNPSSSGVI